MEQELEQKEEKYQHQISEQEESLEKMDQKLRESEQKEETLKEKLLELEVQLKEKGLTISTLEQDKEIKLQQISKHSAVEKELTHVKNQLESWEKTIKSMHEEIVNAD